MCGDAANTAGAEFAKSFRQVQALDHWQPENRAHRVAHGAPEKRAAGRSANEQRLDAKRRAVAHQHSHILGIGKPLDRREKMRMRALLQHRRQRLCRRNFADGQHPLKHRKTGKLLQGVFLGEVNGNILRPRAD